MRIEHGNIKYHNTDFYKSDIEEMCVVKNKGIVVLSDLKKQDIYTNFLNKSLKKIAQLQNFLSVFILVFVSYNKISSILRLIVIHLI